MPWTREAVGGGLSGGALAGTLLGSLARLRPPRAAIRPGQLALRVDRPQKPTATSSTEATTITASVAVGT